jgi:hypothetical protein
VLVGHDVSVNGGDSRELFVLGYEAAFDGGNTQYAWVLGHDFGVAGDDCADVYALGHDVAVGATASQLWLIGANLSLAATAVDTNWVYAFGHDCTIAGDASGQHGYVWFAGHDLSVAGDGHGHLWLTGRNNSVAGTGCYDVWMTGAWNAIDDAASYFLFAWGHHCSITGSVGGDKSNVWLTGHDLALVGSGMEAYLVGHNIAIGSGVSTWAQLWAIGRDHTVTGEGDANIWLHGRAIHVTGDDAVDLYLLGKNHAVGGASCADLYLLGQDHAFAGDTTSIAYGVGYQHAVAGESCSHLYLFGRNAAVSGDSNSNLFAFGNSAAVSGAGNSQLYLLGNGNAILGDGNSNLFLFGIDNSLDVAASGISRAIVIGGDNLLTGGHDFAILGWACDGGAVYSTGLGYQAKAAWRGQVAHAGASFDAEPGTAQGGHTALSCSTSDGSSYLMGPSGVGSYLPLGLDRAYVGWLLCVVRSQDGRMKSWKVELGAQNNNGTSTLVASATTVVAVTAVGGEGAWSLTPSVDDATDSLRFTVVGEASELMHWTADLWTSEAYLEYGSPG